jgi:hypothetical protein
MPISKRATLGWRHRTAKRRRGREAAIFRAHGGKDCLQMRAQGGFFDRCSQ